MSDISYYLRAHNGRPIQDELFAISPWFIAEAILQNAIIATENHFRNGRFPDEIKVDRFVTTVQRKVCSQTNTYIYEIFFDNYLQPITFLSIGCHRGESVALHTGTRDRKEAIHRLSNYPYLDVTLSRLEAEFSLPKQNFAWTHRPPN